MRLKSLLGMSLIIMMRFSEIDVEGYYGSTEYWDSIMNIRKKQRKEKK